VQLSAHAVALVSLLGLTAAWNAGNVGPVAAELATEYETTLASIGVLTGTVFFAMSLIALAVSAPAAERIGVISALRFGCLCMVVGNVVLVVTPVEVGLAVGRLIAAVSLAWIVALAPVYARQVGGVLLIGIFGASFQLGIAGALIVGSVLSDAGVDWRVGFAISAAVGLIALALLHGVKVTEEPLRRTKGFLRAAVGKLRVYRLALLFISVYGIPIVLGAWLVQYLIDEGGLRAAAAGALSFVLFATSAAMRFVGAEMQKRGTPHIVLAGLLGLAAGGMVLLVIESSLALALPAVLALGAGFALPYAEMLVEGQELFPREPAEPLALVTMFAFAFPIPVIPLIGLALDDGSGELALGALAAILVVATLANLRPTGRPVTDRVGDVSGEADQ
jgi:MFS family permease